MSLTTWHLMPSEPPWAEAASSLCLSDRSVPTTNVTAGKKNIKWETEASVLPHPIYPQQICSCFSPKILNTDKHLGYENSGQARWRI